MERRVRTSCFVIWRGGFDLLLATTSLACARKRKADRYRNERFRERLKEYSGREIMRACNKRSRQVKARRAISSSFGVADMAVPECDCQLNI